MAKVCFGFYPFYFNIFQGFSLQHLGLMKIKWHKYVGWKYPVHCFIPKTWWSAWNYLCTMPISGHLLYWHLCHLQKTWAQNSLPLLQTLVISQTCLMQPSPRKGSCVLQVIQFSALLRNREGLALACASKLNI